MNKIIQIIIFENIKPFTQFVLLPTQREIRNELKVLVFT